MAGKVGDSTHHGSQDPIYPDGHRDMLFARENLEVHIFTSLAAESMFGANAMK